MRARSQLTLARFHVPPPHCAGLRAERRVPLSLECGLPLSSAHCPGCPAAVCCVWCSHAFSRSRLWRLHLWSRC
eukprot:5605220-Pleurochrysis_carterae.AAC.1